MLLVEWAAIVTAGLFSGGALYVALIEHPARMAAGIRVALVQFRPSYLRAAPWQGLNAVVCLVAATAAWIMTGGWTWLAGGLFLGANVPLTLIVIAPTNDRLLDARVTDQEAAELFERWARLHWIRTFLGVAGFVLLGSSALYG